MPPTESVTVLIGTADRHGTVRAGERQGLGNGDERAANPLVWAERSRIVDSFTLREVMVLRLGRTSC
jgi:hypothetical protein